MNKIVITIFFSLVCFISTVAQNMTPQEYIEQYKDIAISEMKRMGVPAAITLAQGLMESQSGNSDLVKASNNHFGIKCKSTWTAETVSHDDDELGECFRKYKTAEDSYRDHSNFLRGNSRYDFLFKLNPADYKAWAYGLRKAGYATNPKYPQILIKSIETYNLEQYTLQGENEIPVFQASNYKDDPDDNAVAANTDLDSISKPMNLTINGLKALYAPKGTSLLAIATENNINLSKLLAVNELSKDGIMDKGQYIFLEKKNKEGDHDFCVAEPGETLYDVAQKNGVVLENLYAYNKLTPGDYLVAGTKIYLRQPKAKEVTAFVVNAGDNNTDSSLQNNITAKHEVVAKESLYSISKKYGVSVDQLKEWNHLTSNNLQIGQQLIISK